MGEYTKDQIVLFVEMKNDGGYHHMTATPALMMPNGTLRCFPSYSGVDGCNLDLRDLKISAQAGGINTPITDKLAWYAWSVEYHDVFALDAERVGSMQRTLGTIAKRMEASTQIYGMPESFPAFVLRAAHAMGIKQFAFKPKRVPAALSGNEYVVIGADSAMYRMGQDSVISR